MSIVLIGLTGSVSHAQTTGNNPGLHLDRTEVQRFEQSYEAWVQSIVSHVMPKAHVSVLTEFTYSTNPELIQNYEERHAADHLPGLPDVTDLNSQPTENPLYELITQQNIKVIFDQQPTEDQARVLKEILAVKLNLDTAHGDQITFDQLQSGNGFSGKSAVLNSKNTKIGLFLVLIAAMTGAGFVFRKNKINAQLKEMGEKEINAHFSKLNPISTILKTDAKLLISVIRKQDMNFLVQLMAHAPIAFNQIILQVFEDEQRKDLFEAYQNERLTISRKKSRYSQLLLAAKIHDELKIVAVQQIDVLCDVSAKINEQRSNMQESLKQLKALYDSQESAQLESEEVSHEASL